MKKYLAICVIVMVLGSIVFGQDNYIASVDVDAGLIKMLYGPVTTTNYISLNNSRWINVYISQAEYATVLAQTENLPMAQRSISFLPAAKVTAAKAAAKIEEADYALWEQRLKALTKLFVIEINKLRTELSLPTYTKAQVEAALKAEM